MLVYDSNNKEIGKVADLYLGSVSETEAERGEGPATATDRRERGDTLVDDIARGFTSDDKLPRELEQRLLLNGFIRVDGGGLFGSARYVLPEQIAGVSRDRVQLRVTRDELLKQ